MVITKKYVNEMLGTLLVLSALLSTASAVDCNGKSFHCVNSTHFMICVDLGGGVSQAIDNFFIACPPPTVCQGNNHFECEFPAPTTPATTLSNVISETSLPWEEVVTASSPGNATKEFSENYMNTEKITATAEYSVTTDATMDLTAINAPEINVYNEFNTPEIGPTLAAEFTTTAIETKQTVNENVNTTEYVPTVAAVDITTAVIENVTKTTAESKNLTETEPVVVDDITATAVETTTKNIIITDTIAAEIEYTAPSATEQLAQTINENLNMTDTVPTGVEKVPQNATESRNLTETEPVVDDITTTAAETTSENFIKIDTIAVEIEYIAPSPTEQVAQTINEDMNITETVSTGVENVTQTMNETKNITETGPIVFNDITATALETTTDNIIITDTIAAEINDIAPSATEQVAQPINENMNITETVSTGVENVTQTMNETKNMTETGPVVVDNITATALETTTDNIIITDSIAAEINDIALSATQQIGQNINENLYTTETVPTSVNKVITTTVDTVTQTTAESGNFTQTVRTYEMTAVENVTQTMNETKNMTETGPVVVDDITATGLETTTDNIIITDTIAAEINDIALSATQQIGQNINENLYTTGTVPTSVNKVITTTVDTVTQTTAESGNFTQTERTYEMTATTIETTTDGIIITDSLGAELGYIEPTATEQLQQTTNDNLRELETVQSNTELPQVTILFQNVTVTKNTLLKEPSTEHKFPLTKVGPTSKTAYNITISNSDIVTDLKTKTEKSDSDVQNNLPAETTATVNTIVETTTDNVEHLTTISVEKSTDDYTTVSPLDNKFKDHFKFERVNASEPSKPLISFEGSVRSNASIVINKEAAANEIENKEKQMPSVNDTVVPKNIVASKNRTQEVKNIIDARVVGSSINLTTSLHTEIFPEATVTTDVSPVFAHDAKENVLHTSTNKILHDKNYTTVSSATNTLNPVNTTVLGATKTVDNGASTEQSTTLIEGILTTDTTKYIVTKNIVPPSQAVNLETIHTDTLLTTVSNAQPMSPAFEDNMKFKIPLPVTENIKSTRSNRTSTNGLVTVQSVNMDTITTEAVDIPTTISNNQPMSPDFEEVMKAEPSLGNGAPATEDIVTTVNNKVDTNIFMTPQALDLDIITTDAMFMPTTVSYGQAFTFEEIATGVPLLATENILSSVNNGASTNVFMTSQPVNAEIINTEAMYIPNTISNAQQIAPTFEDNITTDLPLSTTENILSSVNNGASTNGLATAHAVNIDTINTDASTITSAPPLAPAFEDNMNTYVPLPASVNVISSVNNEVSTNGLTTAPAVNVDTINAEVMYIPTTISNAQPIAPFFEENITTNVSLAAIDNILTSVRNRTDRDGLTTAQAVNADSINAEVIPTTITNASPMVPALEENITTKISLSTTENILSSVNNGASTNGLAPAHAVNVDIINTDAMYTPTTITSAQPLAPAFEDNMNTYVPLPASVNVISSVNNGVSTNGLTTAQAVNVDTLNAEVMYIPTTISNAQPIAPFFDENITTNVSLAAIDNILTSVKNGTDKDGLTTAQAVNVDSINAEAIPTTITNASPMVPAFEENITIKISLSTTENILSSVNNGASTNGLAPAHAVNVDTINTDAMYTPTTITSAPPLAPVFEDKMNTYMPLPASVNVISSVNNGVSTNGLTTAQAVNVDSINAEVMYISTTISNAQPIAPNFEENITTNVSLAAIDNILTSVKNGTDRDGLMTAHAVNVNSINAEAIPTTIANASPMVPAFEKNITTKVSLAATENILSSKNNGADTKGLTIAQPVNLNRINTDSMYIPITITNDPPMAPAFEDNNMRTDVPLPANENMVSSINNGPSTNGFMTTQAANVGIIDTDNMHTTHTFHNASPTAPTSGNNTRTDTTLSAPKTITFPKNYEDSTNGFMIANPMDLEQITQKSGLKTIVQLTPDKYVVPSKNVVINNEKKTSPVYGDIITKESGASVPVIIKESPNTIIHKTQIILNSSTNIGVKLEAIESDVNGNYNDNQMTTIDTNNMYEIGEQHINNNIPNSTVDSGVDESISHISQTGAGNTETTLFPNTHNSQNEVTSAINEVTANVKSTAENVNEQAPVNIVAFSQTGASPISINGNIAKATTKKSIPTSGYDSAFDISNQNWTSQQSKSKTKQTTNNLQPSTVEHNDQADNIIWNPLANQVFNNPNQNPESIPIDLESSNTSTNDSINDSTNERNAASLYSQSEIPVTINSFGMKTVEFATAGIDVSSVPTTLPAKTSGADITIRDNIKNTYKPIEISFNPPSGSTLVETDNNSPRKPGSNAVISLDNQENFKAKSKQKSSIASTSITSDIKPEVKSSVIKDGNSNSPTFVRNNLSSQSTTSQLELPTNTHSFSEATSIRTLMEGNTVIKEDDSISETVMLDHLPLPIKNIKFSAHTTQKPVLMDLKSNSQAENTVIITESYKSETLKPVFAETGIQDSGNGGDITSVSRINIPTSNSQTSGFAKTVSSATFNSQTRVTVGANVSSQPSQHVEKIPNKMASAPNNAHVIPGPKPSGSGIVTNNPDNLHSPNSSNNVNTGIITPESVSESNYESPKSDNIMPHDPVIGYQKSNTTVVRDLKFASQNISFGTEKAPPNSIGSDHMQTQLSKPSTNNTSSIFTPPQMISKSTARTSQMATSNSTSHINNNLTKQVPTVVAQSFSCIYGIRGRYSDKGDCRKFYICIGINVPIVGYCPENTVFSDLKKLCTKNMSHCIRENQFKCPSVGRFSDFMKDNVYYICVSHKNNLYRFKFQCQTGYILDKTTVKCIETKEIESNESVSISSDNSSQTTSSITSSTSVSKSSSSSKNSSRADDSSSKKDNSSKSKKSNEAEDTSAKSEGKDDDEDDEVFKCKKEGKFPIRHECRRYYLCKKNRRTEYRRKIKKCDSDQVFHKDRKKCVDDDSYEC